MKQNTNTTDSAVVSVDTNRHNTLGAVSTKKWILIVVLAVVLLAGLAFVISNRPALKVGKYSYSKQEYAQLVKQAKAVGVNEQAAHKALTKSLASKEAADQLKVTYSTDTASLNQAARYEFNVPEVNVSKLNNYQRQAAVYRVTDAIVRLAEKGGYKAAVVYFPFSRYVYGFNEGSKTALSASTTLIGNPEALLNDMLYARKKAGQEQTAYGSKQKGIDKIIQEAANDPVLDYGQYVNESGRVLVSDDHQLQSFKGSSTVLYVQDDVLKTIVANADKLGKASGVVEELRPSVSGKVPTAIVRGYNMAVGYYFVVVSEKVKAQHGIQTDYTKTVKELANG